MTGPIPPGVVLINCPVHSDERGVLTKPFNQEALLARGIEFAPAESFLSRSKAGVLRGMHYQAGHAAHDKLIYCLAGRILDVVVDVRADSPNFNKPFSIELSANTLHTALLIGKGYAHGFLSLEDDTWLAYYTSTTHCPQLDRGVLWSSIDFHWPVAEPILSARDKSHPPIQSLL